MNVCSFGFLRTCAWSHMYFNMFSRNSKIICSRINCMILLVTAPRLVFPATEKGLWLMNEFRWRPLGVGEPGLVKPGAATALGVPNSSPQCLWRAPWGDGDGLFTAKQGGRVRNKEKLEQQSFSLVKRRKIFPMRTVRYTDCAVFGGSPDPAGGSQITELVCCEHKAKPVAFEVTPSLSYPMVLRLL